MSTAEEREYIAGVFKCPVYDEYSTEETWGIAAQCRRHNYHIFTDSVWLEFLDNNGKDAAPGEVGEIAITTTRNQAMPFIRYLVGDRGRPSNRTCGCGYRLPLMESIEGRSSDWLILPSGRPFEPERILSVIARIIKKHPLLFEEFKVIQQRKDLIVLQYSRGQQFEPGPLEEMLEGLRLLIDEPVTVKAEEGKPSRGAKRQAMESWVTRDKPVLDSLDAR
jgi:phenylacetate-CoA ligase